MLLILSILSYYYITPCHTLSNIVNSFLRVYIDIALFLAYTEIMKVLKSSTEFLNKFGQAMLPKTESERRVADITATVLMILAIIALILSFLIPQ